MDVLSFTTQAAYGNSLMGHFVGEQGVHHPLGFSQAAAIELAGWSVSRSRRGRFKSICRAMSSRNSPVASSSDSVGRIGR